jgi:methionyl-tRNA formyltransferase
MNVRVVFMGSPDFSIPTLEALATHYNVVGVVTQPDRKAGRGRKQLKQPAVKVTALEWDLPIIQPTSLKKEPEAVAALRAWEPDIIVVAAYGQILRPEVLNIPRFGCINVHASLLPRWRGAAPINAAILHGDSETGITIMLMDPGMDTGPIISQRGIPIPADETAGSLFDKLSTLGAELLIDTLPAYLEGGIQPQKQDESLATYAPMLKKSDGELDFTQPVDYLVQQVRAYNPWPGAFTTWNEKPLKIHRAAALRQDPKQGTVTPGLQTSHQGKPAFQAPDGLLILEEVQPAGKKRLPGAIFLQGARDWA